MKPPVRPPEQDELYQRVEQRPGAWRRVLQADVTAAPDGRYRHWDTLHHLAPPSGLELDEWWLAIKFARSALLRPVPLIDPDGLRFQVAMPDPAHEMVHTIDRDAAGQIAIGDTVLTPEIRNRYLVSSLIEEAISSSQLEGASTSRIIAKEMIRSGRPPRDRSERMIFNNFRAMNLVREWRNDPLTPDRVLQLHRVVTDQTLDDPASAGRLQGPDEGRVAVYDRQTGELRHAPPPADQLPSRLEALCAFANSQATDTFLHPVVRSIILHFWLVYDHPFADGNGRTARALFYWSMLHRGYWLTEFLTISTILNRAPARYERPFLYVESDDRDLTYFVLSQLRVVCQAIDDLHSYLERKVVEVRETERLLRSSSLNHRQIALLSNALRRPDAEYTVRSHRLSHGVVYQTARTDLLTLVARGLLSHHRVGKRFVFRPVEDIQERVTGTSDEYHPALMRSR